MSVKQVSIFLENNPGQLLALLERLEERQINIYAYSISDTGNYGVLRMITSHPEDVSTVLKTAGYTFSSTDVVAVYTNDRPGCLAEVIRLLTHAKMDVDYTYAFSAGRNSTAYIILRVADIAGAESLLADNGITFCCDGLEPCWE